MTKKVTIRLNSYGDNVGKTEVEAELVKGNKSSVWVKLPNGDVIKRKKDRDIVSS